MKRSLFYRMVGVGALILGLVLVFAGNEFHSTTAMVCGVLWIIAAIYNLDIARNYYRTGR